MKNSNLAIVSVSEFQGKESEPDKNGLNPVYLTPICGVIPNRNVIAGTVAQNTGLEIGKSYLVKWSRLEDDEEYGAQFGYTKVSEVNDQMMIINSEASLGAGRLLDAENMSKSSVSTTNTTVAESQGG